MPHFKVRLWTRVQEDPEDEDAYPVEATGPKSRWPSQLLHIEARDGKTAAHEAARILGVPSEDWWDAGASPRVVIRVSTPTESDP